MTRLRRILCLALGAVAVISALLTDGANAVTAVLLGCAIILIGTAITPWGDEP